MVLEDSIFCCLTKTENDLCFVPAHGAYAGLISFSYVPRFLGILLSGEIKSRLSVSILVVVSGGCQLVPTIFI